MASLLIAALILPRSWALLKESSAVLLEIAPAGLDLDAVRRHVAAMPGVVEVHDLHAWTITSGIPSLSAHVTVTDEALAEHGVGGILDRLCECVASHFDVRHATSRSSRGRTATTRTWATCTPDGSPNPGCGSTGRCRRCRCCPRTRSVAAEQKPT